MQLGKFQKYKFFSEDHTLNEKKQDLRKLSNATKSESAFPGQIDERSYSIV